MIFLLINTSHCISFPSHKNMQYEIFFLNELRKLGQRINKGRKTEMKPGERLVHRISAVKCVSFMASYFKNKTVQLTFLKMWLLDQESPSIFFFSAVERLVLFYTLFFLPCLRKYST